MNIRIADIINESIVDGPGLRFTIFAQGCPHNCKGCHNPSTHGMDGGRFINIDTVLNMIDDNPLLDGVTFSGGEPLLQYKEFAEIAKEVRKRDLNVMVYTGYNWEELINSSEKYKIFLENVDFLVDGVFIEDLRNIDLKFKGSENQRIIDVKQSLEKNKCVEVDWY